MLVPPSCVTEEYESQAGPRLGITGGVARDATPADLERGGFAPLSAFVGPLDLLSPPTLAGALEAIGGIQKDADRWEGELATVKRDYADIQRQLGEERERAETAEAARDALRDQITAAGCEAAHAGERTYECDVARPCGLCRLRTRAEKAERERDEARRDLGSVVTAATAAGWNGNEGTVWDFVAHLAPSREWDAMREDRDTLLARAAQAERERDEALLRAHTGVVHYDILRQSGEEAARQRDEARAELARLTAPGEGSLDNGELVAAITRGGSYRAEDFDVLDLQEAYRLGGAHMGAKGHSIGCKCGRRSPATKDEDATIDAAQDAGWQVDGVNDCAEDMCPKCQRARHAQPAKDRATDEELGRVFGEAYTVEESPDHGVALRTAYLAVAAHVRQERCLVAEAVGMGTGVTISRTSKRVPGTTGMWNVYATRRPDVPGEHYAYDVPASDVPATLARLLGEVSRG